MNLRKKMEKIKKYYTYAKSTVTCLHIELG